MEKTVPKELFTADPYAKDGVAHFEYLGEYEGKEAWVLVFNKDVCYGYPFVYLWKEGAVEALDGETSLKVCCSFAE